MISHCALMIVIASAASWVGQHYTKGLFSLFFSICHHMMLLISLMCGVINRKQPSHTGELIQIKMCCTFFFRAEALICSYLSIFSFLLYKLREIPVPFGSYTWAEKVWWNFNIFLCHIFFIFLEQCGFSHCQPANRPPLFEAICV